MGAVCFRGLRHHGYHSNLLKTVVAAVVKPLSRLLVGLLAIPVIRQIRRRLFGARNWDAEFEKDVEQWCRASLILLAATKNAETVLLTWVHESFGLGELPSTDFGVWYVTAGRLLLAISVVEMMPDQELFSIIHPGPKFRYDPTRTIRANIRGQWRSVLRGVVYQHLNRASPLFAILTVFYGGVAGWVFCLLAIVQYLIIGLVTSRDRALDVLSRFDRAVAQRRQEILDEFEPSGQETPQNERERGGVSLPMPRPDTAAAAPVVPPGEQ